MTALATPSGWLWTAFDSGRDSPLVLHFHARGRLCRGRPTAVRSDYVCFDRVYAIDSAPLGFSRT